MAGLSPLREWGLRGVAKLCHPFLQGSHHASSPFVNWFTNVGTFRLKVLSKLIEARNKQISYKCKDVLDDYPPLAKTEIQDNIIEQGPTFHT